MASGKGITFKLGKMMYNLSGRGLATKDSETGEIRRHPFPWVQVPKPDPEYNPEEQYDEENYDPEDQDYDEAEYEEAAGEYYVPEDEDGDYDVQPAESFLDKPWVMWAALVLLPPLGVWLLWRNNRFEIILRSIISAVSLIWFIIMLIWLFTSMNSSPDDTNTPPLVTPSPSPTAEAAGTPEPTDAPTAIPSATETPTIEPSATPQTGGDTTGTVGVNPSATAEQIWVWSKEGGENYHLDQTCRGMEGANRVLLQVALNRRQTACPDCFPTEETTKPTATPIPAGSYFSRPDGTWYHTDPNCKGMTSAQVVTQAEAIERGQTACPTCIGSVYMTDGGANYHSNSSCRGMQNAYLTTVENAIAAGKTACETCMTGTATGTTGTTVTGNNGTTTTEGVYWYNPNGGKYYHTTATCGGMKNAIQGSANAAENNGLTACPTCLGGKTASANFWYTTNGTWYHTKSNCQGMTGAVRVSEATAIARGKTACPECAGGTATGGNIVNVNTGNTTTNNNNTTVTGTAGKYYSTVDGENFHSSPTCRGMAGATEVDAKTIAERGQTPCPRCIGTSGIYYSTKDGTWYHSKANCQGMTGADIVTLAMINARKQTACPECIGGATGTAYYWATADGSHFHSKSNCSGMANAAKITDKEAEARGQTACPTCVGSVWGTEDGQWYHKNRTCKGMDGAVRMTIQAAEKSGKTACPTCIKNATPTPVPTATPKPGEDDNDGALYYYATDDGTYYHRVDNCTGMRGAEKVSEKTATGRGQKPCPTCIGSVYATEDGDHYHSDPKCSGMRGATLVTVDTAELRGQSACPVCLDGDNGANEGTGTETGGTTTVDPDTTMVYCTLTGAKYHSDKTCGGMRYAADVPLSWALEHNYRRCTDCNAPAAN